MNGSGNGEDENEAEPSRRDAEFGVGGDQDCADGVVLFIVGCLSEADEVVGAADIVL